MIETYGSQAGERPKRSGGSELGRRGEQLAGEPSRTYVAIVTGRAAASARRSPSGWPTEGVRVAASARTLEPDPRSTGSLSETVGRIRAAGGEAVAIPCDLAKPEDRQQLVAAAVEQLGPVDILVNNAAVTYLLPFTEFPGEAVAADVRGAGARALRAGPTRRAGHAGPPAGLDPEHHQPGRHPRPGSPVRPDLQAGIHGVRDGQGRPRPLHHRAGRRALRRRHRRQLAGAMGQRRHARGRRPRAGRWLRHRGPGVDRRGGVWRCARATRRA